jgi:hypothetical protein
MRRIVLSGEDDLYLLDVRLTQIEFKGDRWGGSLAPERIEYASGETSPCLAERMNQERRVKLLQQGKQRRCGSWRRDTVANSPDEKLGALPWSDRRGRKNDLLPEPVTPLADVIQRLLVAPAPNNKLTIWRLG